MQWIEAIKSKCIGKKCLIIGGGMSVLEFPFEKLTDDFIKISINDSIPENVKVDYLFYNDGCFIDVLKEKKLYEKTTVVSYANSRCSHCTYIYGTNHTKGCTDSDNTGLKVLVIAKDVLEFKEIYIIGFDFQTCNVNGKKQSHFFGDEIGHKKKYSDQTFLDEHYSRLDRMPEEFNIIKDRSGIWNCYKYSRLKIFAYGLPWDNKE